MAAVPHSLRRGPIGLFHEACYGILVEELRKAFFQFRGADEGGRIALQHAPPVEIRKERFQAGELARNGSLGEPVVQKVAEEGAEHQMIDGAQIALRATFPSPARKRAKSARSSSYAAMVCAE